MGEFRGKYKSNRNVVYSCKYHVVWCPKYRVPSLWTNSYFVATVGGAPLDVIKQYIEQQKEV